MGAVVEGVGDVVEELLERIAGAAAAAEDGGSGCCNEGRNLEADGFFGTQGRHELVVVGARLGFAFVGELHVDVSFDTCG